MRLVDSGAAVKLLLLALWLGRSRESRSGLLLPCQLRLLPWYRQIRAIYRKLVEKHAAIGHVAGILGEFPPPGRLLDAGDRLDLRSDDGRRELWVVVEPPQLGRDGKWGEPGLVNVTGQFEPGNRSPHPFTYYECMNGDEANPAPRYAVYLREKELMRESRKMPWRETWWGKERLKRYGEPKKKESA